jgi:hypothetical protein
MTDAERPIRLVGGLLPKGATPEQRQALVDDDLKRAGRAALDAAADEAK